MRQFRRARLRAYLLYFPVLLAVFGGAALGFILSRGHGLIWLAQEIVGDRLSPTRFWILTCGATVLLVAGGLIYFLRQSYKECVIESHLFCSSCDAVDADDAGICPICGQTPPGFSDFYYTLDKDEIRSLQAYGLTPCREA